MIGYLLAAALLIAADQAAKYWAFTVLRAKGTLPLLKNVFHLTYVENRGAAFSLFAEYPSRWVFVALALAVAVGGFWVLRKNILQTVLGRCSVLLIVAGALGNAIDRILRGFVVDLFDFRLIHFPVFNIADICICVGGALFLFYMLFQHKEPLSAGRTETRHE